MNFQNISGIQLTVWRGRFLGFYVLAATRRVAMPKLKPEWLDFLIALSLGMIALMYLHNPVGFAGLGGDTVRGSLYLLVAVGMMAPIVLSRTAPFGFVFAEYLHGLPNALPECGMLKLLHSSVPAQRSNLSPERGEAVAGNALVSVAAASFRVIQAQNIGKTCKS
jgi:hypothetical protein